MPQYFKFRKTFCAILKRNFTYAGQSFVLQLIIQFFYIM